MFKFLFDFFFGKRSPATPAAPKPAPVRPSTKSFTIHPAVRTIGWLALAVALVAPLEGYSGHWYYDSVHVKTICYGATAADGVDFSKVYTKAQCEEMLGKDLQKYEAQVRACIPNVDTFPPHRIAALVSFAYNLGPHALCGPVGKYLNAGDVTAGCDAMLAYNHAGGRVLAGLTARRKVERAMCLRSD